MLPCVSHTNQLFLKHGVDNVQDLISSFNKIQEIAKKIKKSNKKADELKRCQKILEKQELSMILFMKVRWNSWLLCIQRYQQNREAIEIMSVDRIFEKQDEKDEWKGLLQSISKSMPSIDFIIPVMTLIAQFIQVMS